MKLSISTILLLFSGLIFAQLPDQPFNPMTAPGGRGISTTGHTLYWQNPIGILYNVVYFGTDSLLVANQDTSVRVKNGFPSIIFSSYSLIEYGTLTANTKYYWKVVEYNNNGTSISPLWYFNTYAIADFEYEYTFNTGLDEWQFFGPLGFQNWYWLNSNQTGGSPGELVFRWDPIFIGDSYFISPNMTTEAGATAVLNFKYYEDWWSDTVVVGCAVTTDYGANWTSVWELQATGNSGPDSIYVHFEVQDSFRLGFYYTGNSNNIDFLFLNDVSVNALIPLTPPAPPQMMTTTASETEQRVSINWTPGFAPSGLIGYELQRKTGTPDNNSPYYTLTTTDINTVNYDDFDIELNQSYTYRVRSLVMGLNSQYGNESTAYVPEVVPVELVSFSHSITGNTILLNWSTASEKNNSGFEIERKSPWNESWETIVFVNGNGTTTEPKNYSYKDQDLIAGKYYYRLKQIDFDGSFEYSNSIEIEIDLPSEFVLEQNYPNPFNPTTTIRWQSPENGHQSLKIYDLIGNEVAILLNEYKPAGIYEVEFDATELTSGVYFYKLISNDFISTKKMLLLK